MYICMYNCTTKTAKRVKLARTDVIRIDVAGSASWKMETRGGKISFEQVWTGACADSSARKCQSVPMSLEGWGHRTKCINIAMNACASEWGSIIMHVLANECISFAMNESASGCIRIVMNFPADERISLVIKSISKWMD